MYIFVLRMVVHINDSRADAKRVYIGRSAIIPHSKYPVRISMYATKKNSKTWLFLLRGNATTTRYVARSDQNGSKEGEKKTKKKKKKRKKNAGSYVNHAIKSKEERKEPHHSRIASPSSFIQARPPMEGNKRKPSSRCPLCILIYHATSPSNTQPLRSQRSIESSCHARTKGI